MRRFLAGMALSLGALLGFSSPALAVTGSQTFVAFGNFTDPVATVIGSGPISGSGSATQIGPESERDVYPSGTVVLNHPVTSESESFDPVTCVGRRTFAGTYSLEQGTGAYAGVSGSGTFEGQAYFLTERTAEGCSEDLAFSFYFLRATGTTTLP